MTKSISRSTQVIPAVAEYFGHNDLPIITSVFTPSKGWKNTGYNKRVSRSWLRKLRREGVTHVQLTGLKVTTFGPEHVHPDFSVAELLKTRVAL